MPSTLLIRRRIRSVRNTAKITHAMEMIATSKMKRAQDASRASRPYSEKITEVMASLASLTLESENLHPLLARRPVKKIEIVEVTPDRGLCGGLNANINRKTAGFILEQKLPVTIVSVGRKGLEFMRRLQRDIRAEFIRIGDRPTLMDTLPISRIVIDDYSSGFVDKVYVSYTEFVTTMSQQPVIRQILPFEPEKSRTPGSSGYIFEPNSMDVFNSLLPRFVEMQVYHAVLESNASFQSAQMVAMRNATENANDLSADLVLMFNKARQEAITKELLDIAGGAEAINVG